MTLNDVGRRFGGLPSGVHTILTAVIGAVIIGLGSWMFHANADLAALNQKVSDADFQAVKANQERAQRDFGEVKTGVATIIANALATDRTIEQGRQERLKFEEYVTKRLDDLQTDGRARQPVRP
jgi:hypothetical protein